ncbi:hypothetical protein [Neisseria elongata]
MFNIPPLGKLYAIKKPHARRLIAVGKKQATKPVPPIEATGQS